MLFTISVQLTTNNKISVKRQYNNARITTKNPFLRQLKCKYTII